MQAREEGDGVATDRKPEFFAGKDARVGIIGCGYVGLPLALRFADVGHSVTGFDLDKSKVDKLNAGQSYIQHIPADKIRAHVQAKAIRRHHGFLAAEADGRGTDLRAHSARRAPRARPDLRRETAKAIAPNLQRNQLIVLESTTYPGTTEELVLPILEKRRPEMPDRARRRPLKTSPPTSISLFRPSARTPATSNTAWRRFPRSSAESILRAAARQRDSTRRLFPRSCRSARRAPPKWSSCSKTSSAA